MMKKSFSIKVVLVRTLYESNVGATSRAMANMGASDLILIDPKCDFTIQSQKAAATGQYALQNRRTYLNWVDFLKNEEEGIRISFTARDGRSRQVRDFAETLKWLQAEHPLLTENKDQNENAELKVGAQTNADLAIDLEQKAIVPIYLIFGPEDWGLSAEDLSVTHFACSIPTFGDNTSLNLAQAVLLALYTLRLHWGGTKALLEGHQSKEEKRKALESQEVIFPENTLRIWLTEMGFDISSKRMNAFTVMRRILLQNVPSKKELNMLEIILQQSIRKLREYNELRKKYRQSSS